MDKKINIWKTLGVDQVKNYWFKHLQSLRLLLTEIINLVNNELDSSLTWLTNGKTILAIKKREENQPKNYRPITCIPTTYKLVLIIVTDRVYGHISEIDILPVEHKGCRCKLGGCTDQLLINKHILERTKTNERNFSLL